MHQSVYGYRFRQILRSNSQLQFMYGLIPRTKCILDSSFPKTVRVISDDVRLVELSIN